MRFHDRRFVVGLIALLAAPVLVSAQVPAGPEFRVNTYTPGLQWFPSVAAAPGGGFVVAWREESDRSIAARHFDATGTPSGPQFRASTVTGFHQRPQVAADGQGRFIVAWDRNNDILARRLDRAGNPIGAEFLVNRHTTNAQFEPSVAADKAGNFVVSWTGNHPQDNLGILARRFDASGAAMGDEFRVNTYTTGEQSYPTVAAEPGGGFVVVWESDGQDGSVYGVFGQRFDAVGQRRGAEFLVNSHTTGHQYRASVAVAPRGDFLVAWRSFQFDGGGDIFAQRFDAAGARQGGEFRVNVDAAGFQLAPVVAADAAGTFLVAWHGNRLDDPSLGVSARRLEGDGTPRGAEFRVNSYTPGYQVWPAATMDAVGNAVVTWESFGQDGSERDIFGQRVGGLLPAALRVDTSNAGTSDGNGVLEPGESVDMEPAWRNASGAARTFAAGLSDIAGPPGAAYTITDGAGNYGTVADGTSQPCTDCYGVSVSQPASRPALHWDASVLESITPDVLGQRKRWLLHVGDSFADVPRGSGFYRFVETLLHHGVTGGCSTTGYCPGVPTGRAQMAVFVLVAREKEGYRPPACTTPVFNDVPATSPFCPFVEELARRGVVSGCGGGSFCPTAAVTREQMAVFVLRTLDPSVSPPPCTAPLFADVPASSPFCRWIEELARRGVVAGCGGGNYCPAGAVTREQMAVFIAVAFGLTLYGP